jgi:hypothetical protein
MLYVRSRDRTSAPMFFRENMYYTMDSVNSAAYVRHFGVRLLYCSHSTIVLSIKAYVRWGTTIRPR